MLPVGKGSSGDAIALRWWIDGFSPKKQKVMIIDGGTKESGQALIEHIDKYYKTNRVDYVINTHPDKDHASGLTEVLKEKTLNVGELWIHRPWEHVSEIVAHVKNCDDLNMDGRTTEDCMQERFAHGYYKYAKKLEEHAKDRGIAIKEPYQGKQIGMFQVLSPSKDWYLYDLIPNSDKTWEVSSKGKEDKSVGELSAQKLKKEVACDVDESLYDETLQEDGMTSRENESSVVLYANLGLETAR
ncbi:hypothetical protein NHP21005_17350 [Helicobacter sp. NHP21005]|uniref:MBL fold metallo-hydrolase n=1 Tax=Helicobacter felistomachi TaxID=3040201 RepID=UPI0025727F6B|nr:MBL fold metallo-hydrolase [Helicobacter sp. NHP21005]BEG58047.1 hypothetical protein NHP21005_17350 [Helicobacter sp. NHP21005]